MTDHAEVLLPVPPHSEASEVTERPSNEDIAEAAHAPHLFDARFAVTAVVVGAAYCLLVLAIRKFVSTEAGGVAGVALTTLAVALFRRFETLRFARTPAAAVVGIPQLSIAYLLVVIFAFLGIQIVTGLSIGFVLIARSPNDPTALLKLISMADSNWFIAAAIAGVAILHFAAGMLTGRVSVYVPGVTYTYVLLASLVMSALNAFPLFAGAIITGHYGAIKDSFSNLYFLTWLLYIATAFAGAYLGLLTRRSGGEEYIVVRVGGA